MGGENEEDFGLGRHVDDVDGRLAVWVAVDVGRERKNYVLLQRVACYSSDQGIEGSKLYVMLVKFIQ